MFLEGDRSVRAVINVAEYEKLLLFRRTINSFKVYVDILFSKAHMAIIVGPAPRRIFDLVANYLHMALGIRPARLPLLRLLRMYKNNTLMIGLDGVEKPYESLDVEHLGNIVSFRTPTVRVTRTYACSMVYSEVQRLARTILNT